MRLPRFTWVSDGKPLRRLLLTSKAIGFEVFLFDSHDTPPPWLYERRDFTGKRDLVRQFFRGSDGLRRYTPRLPAARERRAAFRVMIASVIAAGSVVTKDD
jgi:hypothetical protein